MFFLYVKYKEEENMEEFKDLVLRFAKMDAEQKYIKKQADPLKDRIKKHMSENDMDTFKDGPVSASFRIQERKTMSEARLLSKLKSLGLESAIKTVEVPDQQAIEDLIYEGALDPSELDDCIDRKYVEVLRVSGGDELQ